MIYFNSERIKIYCKIIHSYLEVELFGDQEIDIGDEIEYYMPKYLFREQYQKCIDVFTDLYEWTEDEFLHEFTAFHEVALYYFLKGMCELKEDYGENFKLIYYDGELIKEIKECSKKDLEEMDRQDEFTLEELEDFYYDPYHILDVVYEDVDFLELPYLYNEQKTDMPMLARCMGIDLDYYFEILPMDIQKKYKNNHVTLTGEVNELFNYIQGRINNGSLAELFWENGKQISEKRIQIILENIMDAYFIGKGVDISREVLIKNGQVDFKLFRSNNKNEKILIEVKKASSSYLKCGYEKQLLEYIKYSGCRNAFYLIVCFTDHDYEIANKFIRENIYTDTYQMYINISILDARKKLLHPKEQ